jgi:hypothetical protein
MALAIALTVAGLAAGCHVDPPPAARTAVVDGSPGRPADPLADPLADIDAVLDDVEHDLDAATADG